MARKQVLVIGAGVSGLSTAILLYDAGYSVSVCAKDLTLDTTSNKAAAFWYPYLCNPRDKAITWSKSTYKYLENHVMKDPASGVKYIYFTEFLREKSPDPWWRPAVDIFERPTPDEMPKGYADGYRTRAIVMDTSLYLPWLLDQLSRRDIHIKQEEVRNFEQPLMEYDAVINCTGLGSRELCNDNSIYPVRGQVLRVKPNGMDEVIADESDENLTYIIPRTQDIIIGGTAQPNDWNEAIDPQDTAQILDKVKALSDSFQGVEIIEAKVGLRPARDKVRLELEEKGTKTLVHNYGHGGAGFTLSWGCAEEVVNLVKSSFVPHSIVNQ